MSWFKLRENGRERPKILLLVVKNDMSVKYRVYGLNRVAEYNKCGWSWLIL